MCYQAACICLALRNYYTVLCCLNPLWLFPNANSAEQWDIMTAGDWFFFFLFPSFARNWEFPVLRCLLGYLLLSVIKNCAGCCHYQVTSNSSLIHYLAKQKMSVFPFCKFTVCARELFGSQVLGQTEGSIWSSGCSGLLLLPCTALPSLGSAEVAGAWRTLYL